MAKKADLDYDKENDILYVHTKQNVSDSIDFDNFVIDYSPDGMIVGVEILKASDFIKKFKMSKDLLLHSKYASLSVIQGKEYALIRITIFTDIGKTSEITVPSPVPQKITV